ncbi:MAG: 2-dehydropantoate 2-reductase [Candidatus Gastranaerophilales bacterium]|nr:2-dehydropantoate 2-reductase [Candidatus Gastranaerophilales bacterium]
MKKSNLKYLIVGSGSVGTAIGAFLYKAGKNVVLAAHNKTLDDLNKNGLCVISDVVENGNYHIKTIDSESYSDKADIIFVCVKSYSIDSILPFLKRVIHKNSIIIPILNTFKTGEKIAEEIKTCTIFDGCIYIIASKPNRCTLLQKTELFKIVFGPIKSQFTDNSTIKAVISDLNDAKIECKFSNNIDSEKFKKFSLTSAFASTGAFYDITTKEMQQDGKYRNTLIQLLTEQKTLSQAMKLDIDIDILKDNLAIIDEFNPECTASMQRDLKERNESEISGLLFDVTELSKRYNVPMPEYNKIANHFKGI